jgi:chromosome segregation ATPase
MSMQRYTGGPPTDTDQARLDQMDQLIAQIRQAEQQEAARKAEEARRLDEREAAGPGYTLEQLERKRAELAAEIALRQHHVETEEQRQLMRRRADRLQADITELEGKLATTKAELAVIEARLAK